MKDGLVISKELHYLLSEFLCELVAKEDCSKSLRDSQAAILAARLEYETEDQIEKPSWSDVKEQVETLLKE